MPEAREHTPLGEVGSFFRGRGGTKEDQRREGVPCVRYGELYTHHDIRIRDFVSFVETSAAARYTALLRGDIVFAGSGETHEEIGKGAVYTSDTPAVAGSDTIILRPSSGVDPVFLSYAANSDGAARFKARHGQGSSVIHIGTRHLQKLEVWLPPLPEQRLVVKILDTLDEAIRKTEAIIAKLKQVKQGLLHDLLARGIDDNGELRDPERHPEQFKDSPLGRIPRDWDTKRISDIATVGSGTTPSRKAGTRFYGPGYYWVKTLDLNEDLLDRTEEQVTGAALRQTSLALFAPGTVLVAMYGGWQQIGRTALLRAEAATNQAISAVCIETGEVVPEYVLRAFQHGRQRWKQVAASTRKDPNITKRDVLGFCVPVPPTEEQRNIVGSYRASLDQLAVENVQAERLRLLKQGLMEDLLTGRVRVTDLLKEAAE